MTEQLAAKARRIVVTGASGFVGKELVPLLIASGADILLVGREPERLAALFPGVRCASYERLAAEAGGYDLLLHLATLNTDAARDLPAFRAVNVDFLLETVERARAAGVPRFVNVSSVHALDPGNASPYARSKREAAERLGHVDGVAVTTLYLPLVYGARWPGSLAVLNRLPGAIARAVFRPLASLKPTLHVSRLATFLMAGPMPAGGSVILTDGQRDNATFLLIKRFVDLGAVFVIAFFFWWALALIWALVKLRSPGPGLFAQERVGRNGRIFTCYKFRTMTWGAPNVASHEAPAALITPFGAFLRNTKLDELPQIVNILRNDMSLVGPRPCLPMQEELIDARKRNGVLELKPGISGLAQINNIDMRDPAVLAGWDRRYRDLQCLVLDVRILLATARGSGRGDAARALS